MTREKLKGHAAMLAANMSWGLMSPISKSIFLIGTISAISLTTFRLAGAAIVFWIASLFTRKEPVSGRDQFKLFWASLFGITLNQGSFVFGISMTSPIDASVVATSSPIITMILAAIVLKEPLTGKKVLGVLTGLSGALLLIFSNGFPGNTASQGSNPVLGNFLCLCAEIAFSLYFVLFKDLIDRYSPITLMKWMFLYAGICCIPFSWGELLTIPYAELPLEIIGDIAFIIFGATFFSYLMVPIGQKRLRPTIVSMYNYVQPLTASMLAVWWGMDRFTLPKAAAILLIFTGVWIVTRSKSRAQVEAEQAARQVEKPMS